jgi:hypothetical protein
MNLVSTSGLQIQITRINPDLLPTDVDAVRRFLGLEIGEHDGFLSECIKRAVDEVEAYTGCLLTPSLVTTQWTSFNGAVRLPWGPVSRSEDIELVSGVGSVSMNYTNPESIGFGDFPILTGRYATGVKVSYQGGYSSATDAEYTIPDGLVGAVVMNAAERFVNAGFDAPKKPSGNWKVDAHRYKRY